MRGGPAWPPQAPPRATRRWELALLVSKEYAGLWKATATASVRLVVVALPPASVAAAATLGSTGPDATAGQCRQASSVPATWQGRVGDGGGDWRWVWKRG